MKSVFLLALFAFNALASEPLFPQQWGLRNNGQKIFRVEGDLKRDELVGIPGVDINWPGLEVLSKINPDKELIVAVLDTGIAMTPPEFAGRLYKGKDFLTTEEMADEIGHGTHVAGIIAANADGRGVTGATSSNVKILPLKVLKKDLDYVHQDPRDKKNKFVTDFIGNAIEYAVDAKAQVINMSLGWPQILNTKGVIDALNKAAEAGVVIVAASGNNNKDAPTWPCAHKAVICVGAMDNQGRLTEFTNHGAKVDLVAPGEWIVSTNPTVGQASESKALRISGYEAKNGSSQAAPFVASAVAMLRLKEPNLSIDEIKLRLYSTARKLPADKDGRFVRFGALDFSAALEAAPAPMASILIKQHTTIAVEKDGSFEFSLPLEVLGQSTESIEVSVEGLELENRVSGAEVHFRGRLSDLRQDNEKNVTFAVKLGEKTTRTQATLVFARRIGADDMIVHRVPNVTDGNMLISFNLGVKTPKVFAVNVDGKPTADTHFYVSANTPVPGTKVVATWRASMHDRQVRRIRVDLPNTWEVRDVYERDVNFDGTNDLVIRSIDADKKNVVLTMTDLEGKPLFGEKHSRWVFPVDAFIVPPKGEPDPVFAWLRVKTAHLGEVAVPYYVKNWTLPELDNSKNILENERPALRPRLNYWEPYLDGEVTKLRQRVVDSVAVKKALKKALVKSATEAVTIERHLPQTTEEKIKGINRHFVSVGEGMKRRFFVMTVSTPGAYTLSAVNGSDAFMGNNNIVAVRGISDYELSLNSYFLAMFDRTSARLKSLQGNDPVTHFQTSGWSNPIMNAVGAFEAPGRKTLFLESRHHVYVHDVKANGKPLIKRFPVNRDSSLDQIQFSENLQPVLVRENGVNQPAVAVNSSWIFGDRLVTMVSDGETFRRPVALSVVIPPTCVPLRTQMVSTLGHSAYALLCRVENGAVLSFFPLEVK